MSLARAVCFIRHSLCFLRVTDVTDGLNAARRADLTLLDPAIRPLCLGMGFWVRP
jgi:hypothetical protein